MRQGASQGQPADGVMLVRNELRRPRLTAATADRHMLYEASVQSIDVELDLFERVFRRMRGRAPRFLREDFCGTAAMACAWIHRGRKNSALGVDLHRPTLRWAMQHHVRRLGKDADRISLICDDVLSVQRPRADLVVALNYSYSVFKQRDQLRRYFRNAHGSLRSHGLFIVDVFGGTEATDEIVEERKITASIGPEGQRLPAFTYVWQQAHFNPITHEIRCRIHFKFRDGSRLRNAFAYDWRYWTIPEIREIMLEAGFRSAVAYLEGWDDDSDEPDGIYRQRRDFEEMAGWVGYVVGVK